MDSNWLSPSLFCLEGNSGNRSETVTWNTQNTGGTIYHAVQLQKQTPLTEVSDQAEDVTVYFAMPSVRLSIAYHDDPPLIRS